MAKKRKLSKRLRKSAKRVIGSDIARDVFEKLITAALLVAAAKLRDSAAAGRAADAVEELVTGKSGGKRKGKGKKNRS
ncbi:MAG TPA: hypothetical protein VD768_06735 [Sphingomicrobium sp.]|nr:hypothetical protein [Sphingomicrobium sp.]